MNAKGRYGATAVFFAADKGHLEVVKLLVARGAEINIQDTFYRTRPINWALANDHAEVAIFLLEKQSKGAGEALTSGVRSNNPQLVKTALASSDIDRRALQSALASAEREKRAELAAPIKAALDALPADAEPEVKLDPALLQRYVGRYRNEVAGVTATISCPRQPACRRGTGSTANYVLRNRRVDVPRPRNGWFDHRVQRARRNGRISDGHANRDAFRRTRDSRMPQPLRRRAGAPPPAAAPSPTLDPRRELLHATGPRFEASCLGQR